MRCAVEGMPTEKSPHRTCTPTSHYPPQSDPDKKIWSDVAAKGANCTSCATQLCPAALTELVSMSLDYRRNAHCAKVRLYKSEPLSEVRTESCPITRASQFAKS